jgi:hypothetical protein
MKTRLVTVAAAFALIYGLPAMAQSRTQMLKGDFAFTTSAACVVSPASFFPTYQPPAGFSPALVPLGPSFVFTNSFQGVRTFNGDGTGSVTARVCAYLRGRLSERCQRPIHLQRRRRPNIDHR